MDEGEAMMDHAQAAYDASQAAPPPDVSQAITDTPEGTYSEGGVDVMIMDPLVVTPGSDGGDGGGGGGGGDGGSGGYDGYDGYDGNGGSGW